MSSIFECSSKADLLKFKDALDVRHLIKKLHSSKKHSNLAKLLSNQDGAEDQEKLWLIFNNRPLCYCGKQTKFKSYSLGYSKYCSSKCASSSKEVLDKRKRTSKIKYGTPFAHLNIAVKEKIKETNIEKFGVYIPSKNKCVSDKRKRTLISKYDGIGFSSSSINDKIKNAMLDKYGVTNNWQNDNLKEKYLNNRREEFVLKLLPKLKNYGITPINFNYEGITNKYLWECNCGTQFYHSLIKGLLPRCPNCFPPLCGTSKLEQYWFDYIKNIFPDTLNRTKINGVETDIFIPSKKLAFEIDGLYWHSELVGYNKLKHLIKLNKCNDVNVTLIHFFEDDLLLKGDIIKSIINIKLGLAKKIYARQCEIRLPLKSDVISFLNKNHLQGAVKSYSFASGLYFNNELVSVVVFGKSRFKKNEIELLRFASKQNIIVNGGFSKLIHNLPSGRYVTYADRCYSSGNVYMKNGWSKISESGPSYFYFSHKEPWKHNRQQFQKHKLQKKLEKFDNTLTEWENMQLNGWNRIWDCGQNKFEIVI